MGRLKRKWRKKLSRPRDYMSIGTLAAEADWEEDKPND